MPSSSIEVRDLRYRYPGEHHDALTGLSLSVSAGERVAVLGPNGSGKTTFVMHLNGLLSMQSGEIAIGDTSVTEDHLREIRRRVGAVFQDADDQLFMTTVREDVAFGPANLGVTGDELNALVEQTLARVGASGYADRNPHHLSGGEKRRVAIATVLSMNPDVLTYSVHEKDIFPGTGMQDYPERQAFNDALPHNTGGSGLMNAVERFIEVAQDHKPDLIFVAGGADAHWNDPLSSLQYHLEDYEWSMTALREAFRGKPFLFGGAGGYQPDGGTPLSVPP